MTDWTTDVRAYAPDAEEDAVAGIVKHCGIALRNKDSSLVSLTPCGQAAGCGHGSR